MRAVWVAATLFLPSAALASTPGEILRDWRIAMPINHPSDSYFLLVHPTLGLDWKGFGVEGRPGAAYGFMDEHGLGLTLGGSLGFAREPVILRAGAGWLGMQVDDRPEKTTLETSVTWHADAGLRLDADWQALRLDVFYRANVTRSDYLRSSAFRNAWSGPRESSRDVGHSVHIALGVGPVGLEGGFGRKRVSLFAGRETFGGAALVFRVADARPAGGR